MNDKINNETLERCFKCGHVLNSKYSFCTNCGNKQVEVNKKNGSGFLYAFLFVLFLACLAAGGYFAYRYLDNSTDHINYSNKRVTVDDTGIADAVEKVYDSVVVVESYINGKLYGTGSGFVYDTDNSYGYILTNYHVIAGATEVKLGFTKNINETIKAEVVGSDQFSDIAVLKVAKKHIIQVAALGNNDSMRVGDTTFAVGTPLDSKAYSWSVTRGILSGKNRVIESGSSYMSVLQTDTPINSGNSGGPLCNANGEVIGITNMKLASDTIEGIGFAIPIETATNYAEQFVSGKSVNRPYLGVSMYDEGASLFNANTYVVIGSVEAGSPADKAGLKKDDIVLKIENEDAKSTAYFRYKLYEHKAGDKIKITIKRDAKEQVIEVTLGSNKNKND